MGKLLNVLKGKAHSDCIFCDVTPEKGFNVVAQNDKVIAFHDRNPASKVHVLVIPKDHHRTCFASHTRPLASCLNRRSGYCLPRRLVRFAADLPFRSWNLGFHIPPFNSINHLHLHVQVLPYRSIIRKLKYRIAKGHGSRSKGFSWFATLRQAIAILEKGGRVGVMPC
ncbi:HIT-like protein [Schizophyllum commune Loenen D]|nr:HIT-like protein [Schizophyllum commune Loenen D]